MTEEMSLEDLKEISLAINNINRRIDEINDSFDRGIIEPNVTVELELLNERVASIRKQVDEYKKNCDM